MHRDFKESSLFLRKCISSIVPRGDRAIALDAPCGGGRNAILLASLGYTVVCADNDSERLQQCSQKGESAAPGYIIPIEIDLLASPFAFLPNSFDLILNVHFVNMGLWSNLCRALKPGGLILIETYENRGMNYFDLPTRTQWQSLFSKDFQILSGSEKSAGPRESEKVCAKVLALKGST